MSGDVPPSHSKAAPTSSSTTHRDAAASGGAMVPSAAPGNSAPRLSIHNFSSFRARAKKLPPDANVKAALYTKLYQFSERVCFGCVKCRRDYVLSDSVAVDLKNRIMLCTACFTRIIRPRTYTPSRVVPFPSLLSWLNYQPSAAMEMSDDVMERPAEAVAPSGERVSTPHLSGGDRATQLDKLPAIAMRIVRGAGAGPATTPPSLGGLHAAGQTTGGASIHPCIRVWGVCLHGETCLFRNAPADLCLAYLMGLCRGNDRRNEEQASGKAGNGGHHKRDRCRLLHQKVYDLPNEADPAPLERFDGDLDDEESDWARWIDHQRRSPNSAAWQLWHNGPMGQLLATYAPVKRKPAAAVATSAVAEGDANEEEGVKDVMEDKVGARDGKEEEGVTEAVPSTSAPDVKLNLSDIMSALRGMKKDPAAE